jgi:hypothetical protein
MSALGLGRAETHWIKVAEYDWGEETPSFFEAHYALIAATSGWIPMMFITRVRL